MNEQQDNEKKDYVSPIIEKLGTVSDLTMHEQTGSHHDNNQGND